MIRQRESYGGRKTKNGKLPECNLDTSIFPSMRDVYSYVFKLQVVGLWSSMEMDEGFNNGGVDEFCHGKDVNGYVVVVDGAL